MYGQDMLAMLATRTSGPVILADWRCNVMANEVEIIVEPVEPSGLPVERLREWLAGDRNLQEVLGDVDIESLLLSEPEILQRERKDNSPFIATVFDPQQNRAVEVSGFVDQPDSLHIKPSSYRPLPTRDELSNALDILRADSRYASRVGPDDAVVYQPMPPLADLEQDDGTLVRRPTLGIFSPTGTPRHQIVAADLGARDIDWQPAGLDHPTDSDCEAHLPVGMESIADTGDSQRNNALESRGGSATKLLSDDLRQGLRGGASARPLPWPARLVAGPCADSQCPLRRRRDLPGLAESGNSVPRCGH